MVRMRTAIGNWIVGFVLAYALVSRFRSRKSGVKAGVLWGTISAIAGLVVYRRVTRGAEIDVTETDDASAEAEATA